MSLDLSARKSLTISTLKHRNSNLRSRVGDSTIDHTVKIRLISMYLHPSTSFWWTPKKAKKILPRSIWVKFFCFVYNVYVSPPDTLTGQQKHQTSNFPQSSSSVETVAQHDTVCTPVLSRRVSSDGIRRLCSLSLSPKAFTIRKKVCIRNKRRGLESHTKCRLVVHLHQFFHQVLGRGPHTS